MKSLFVFSFISLFFASCSSYVIVDLVNQTDNNIEVTIFSTDDHYYRLPDQPTTKEIFFSARLTESKHDHTLQLMKQNTGKYEGKLKALNYDGGTIVSVYDPEIKKYKTTFLLPPELKLTLFRALRQELMSTDLQIEEMQIKGKKSGKDFEVFLKGSEAIKLMIQDREKCRNCELKIGNITQ